MNLIKQITNNRLTVDFNTTDDLGSDIIVKDNPNYYDIIYNNIHVIKNRFDVGYITSDIKYPFEIWNTYTVNKNILDINYSNVSGATIYNYDGSTVSAGQLILANSSDMFNLSLTMDGESQVNGNIELNISGIIVPIYVNLIRSSIFDYNVNVATNITENYSFVTEVNESVKSNEVRTSWVYNARYDFTYFYTLFGRDKRMIEKNLYSAATQVLSVPIYHQGREAVVNDDVITFDLINTVFQLGMNIFIKDNNKSDSAQIIEIIDMNNIRVNKTLANDFDYPIIYPLVNSRIGTQNNSQNVTGTVGTYTITFEKEIDDLDMLVTNNSTAIKIFNGIPLLDYQTNTLQPHDTNYFRNVSKYDNGISKRDYKVNNKIAKVETAFDYILQDGEAISDIKNFFNEVQGMYKEFYFFSNKHEFIVVENIQASDTILTISNESLTAYYKNKFIKYAVIFYNDTYKIITLNDIYSVNEEKEALVISTPFGINLDKDNIISCQFVFRSRMSTDVLALSFDTPDVASTRISSLKLTKE